MRGVATAHRAVAVAGAIALCGAFPACERGAESRDAASPCPRPETVGPLSSVNPQAGSGQAVGEDPVFVHLEGYEGRRSGRGSFVEIREKRGQAYFIKLFTVLSRPIDGRLRQEVSALEPGKRAGFDLGDEWEPKPRLSELAPRHDHHLSPRSFPLLPGGIWVSGPGCYRLVNEGPGFKITIDFPVGLVS